MKSRAVTWSLNRFVFVNLSLQVPTLLWFSRVALFVTLISAYKPPSVDNNTFTRELLNVLDNATKHSENILCVGDLNCGILYPTMVINLGILSFRSYWTAILRDHPSNAMVQPFAERRVPSFLSYLTNLIINALTFVITYPLTCFLKQVNVVPRSYSVLGSGYYRSGTGIKTAEMNIFSIVIFLRDFSGVWFL